MTVNYCHNQSCGITLGDRNRSGFCRPCQIKIESRKQYRKTVSSEAIYPAALPAEEIRAGEIIVPDRRPKSPKIRFGKQGERGIFLKDLECWRKSRARNKKMMEKL